MEDNNTDIVCKPKCSVWSFCWKNPVHWFIAFAILPFTIKGIQMVVGWVNQAFSSVNS
jgi:hypothetical protein